MCLPLVAGLSFSRSPPRQGHCRVRAKASILVYCLAWTVVDDDNCWDYEKWFVGVIYCCDFSGECEVRWICCPKSTHLNTITGNPLSLSWACPSVPPLMSYHEEHLLNWSVALKQPSLPPSMDVVEPIQSVGFLILEVNDSKFFTNYGKVAFVRVPFRISLGVKWLLFFFSRLNWSPWLCKVDLQIWTMRSQLCCNAFLLQWVKPIPKSRVRLHKPKAWMASQAFYQWIT